MLDELSVAVPAAIHEAEALTPYAVDSRYPDDLPETTLADLTTAIELARIVLEWADARIAK